MSEKMDRISIVFILISLAARSRGRHGRDNTVCTPPTHPNPGPMPKLADQFRVRVECNIVNKNLTTDFIEWYDGPGNRGAIKQWQDGGLATALYDYATKEFIMVTETSKSGVTNGCSVKNLGATENKFLFGVIKMANGTDRIYSVNGALRFGGNIPTNYVGRASVRGITVDAWESCQYWKDFDATMTVKWYFTAKDVWKPAIDVNQIPVRCDIAGVTWVNNNGHAFHHLYEFTDYRPGAVSDKNFEIPRGTFCPHRKSVKKLPALTNGFSFKSEIIMPEEKTITFFKEYYDFQADVVRYDYVPPVTSPFGTNILYEVHDYNTGVAYITDSVLGNCTVTPIKVTSFDAELVGANKVRIRTSKEFFNFQNADYHYAGVRTVRGVKCDVWVAKRTDWPPGVQGVNSLFEWYFATPNVTEDIGYGSGETRVPIMLEVTGFLGNQRFHYIFNYYDFDKEKPLSWNFDISPCYNYHNSTTIQFALSGRYRDVIKINKEFFNQWVLMAIRGVTHQISALRVTNIQTDFGQSDIIVSFRLLDVAPIRGDVTSPVKEISLNDAVDDITAAINSKKFGIQVVTPSLLKGKKFVAKPYSAKSWDTVIKENSYMEAKAGYSSGTMAGAGIGILLVGFMIGFTVLFLLYKKMGGSFKAKKFDDMDPVVTS